MADTILKSITEYFMDCPLLQDGVFRVDALGFDGVEYVVETGTYEPILNRFVNGSTRRQFQFSFGSREAFSMDRVQNLENSGFYERLAEWVEELSFNDILPALPDGMYAEGIEVLSPAYVFDSSMTHARYQMPMRLIYIKEVD